MPTAPKDRRGNPIKERIGIYGPPKVGKTHQFFTIAKWHQDLGSSAKFYGVNTDTSFSVLSTNPEFEHLDNIDWVDAVSFQDMLDGARKFSAVMTGQDWLCMDLQTAAWDLAQDEYAAAKARAEGGSMEDMGDMWLMSGVGDDKYPIGGWDWGMPNARYRALANNVLLRSPGNLMCIYQEADLMKESRSGRSDEDPKIKGMFRHIGKKPKCQKGDPFAWHTILHLDQGPEPKTQRISTAGERFGNRRWLGQRMSNGMVRDEPMQDFFLDYLIGVAGWSMQ